VSKLKVQVRLPGHCYFDTADYRVVQPIPNAVESAIIPNSLSLGAYAALQKKHIIAAYAAPAPSLNGTDDDDDNDDDVQQVPEYKVNNNLRTVKEMWEEWDQGIICDNSGIRSPSIHYLEERYGAAWRTVERSRKRLSRRKLFIQWLQLASRNLNLSEVLVVHKIENWRQSK